MNNSIVTVRKASRRNRRGRFKQSGKPDAVGQYASDAWSLAKRTAYGLNEIRKLINIETKFLDTNVPSYTVSTTGSMTPISEIAQGLTSTTRVGDSLRIQHIEVRGRVQVNTSATNSLVRVMLVRDLDGYGTAPTVADVLEVNASVGAPLSPEKFAKRERFSILFDELICVQSAISTGTAMIPFTFMTTHQGHILYLGSTAAPASDGKGSVYLLAVSDEATDLPTVAFISRILFTDD
jgi:hypothetical protein